MEQKSLKEIIGKRSVTSERLYGHELITNEAGQTFYVVNKKAPFYRFGDIFLGHSMIGESLNKEAVKEAVYADATIVLVYKKELFVIYALLFYNIAMNLSTERTTKTTNEITISIPLTSMTRYRRKHT